jgi:hypothetical protein
MIDDPLDIDVDAQEEDIARKKGKKKLSDKELSELYDRTSARILQDRNDFMLPQIRDLVDKQRWINLRPEYQRRHRWDKVKQSRLIESLLMNAPVPSIFLYEVELNRYEVMDGQQRLASIIDFYKGALALEGLTVWAELEGRTYSELPTHLKRGLDRRRISAVILLAESSPASADDFPDIRKEVFERLNTGGTALNPQELRNCVFAGPFNKMIIALAQGTLFCRMWGIPPYRVNVDKKGHITDALRQNKLFSSMGDCQIVLRFFAFRDLKNVKGSVKRMLDTAMTENRDMGDDHFAELQKTFNSRLNLVSKIFGRDAFRLPDSRGGKHSRPLFDALMIAADRLWEDRKELTSKRSRAQAKVKALLMRENSYEIIVGRPNTAEAVKTRIALVEKALRSAIS